MKKRRARTGELAVLLLSIGFLNLILDISTARADFAPAGQKGVLTVKFEVSGEVDKRVGKRGEGIHWNTQRNFEATIPVQAEKPEKDYTAVTQSAQDLDAQTKDIQKEMAACKEDDIPCQMAAASKMMNTPQMQAVVKTGQEAKKAVARYQTWRAVPGATPDIKLNYKEQWQTIFYTAAKEVNSCTVVAPAISPELKKNSPEMDWEKKNEEQLFASARGMAVEVDMQQGGNRLHLVPIGVWGDQKCSLNIAGQTDNSQDSTNVTFFPLQWQPPGALVAGNGEYETTFEYGLGQTGFIAAGGAEVKAPLHIKISWSLRKN